MKRFSAIVVLTALVCSSSFAQDCWKIATGRTQISFSVKHLVFFDVEGRLKKVEGCIDSFSPDFDGARAEAKVEAASIYTGNKDRDHDLCGEKFLHTEAHPYLHFLSKSFSKIGEDEYKVSGMLSMRGVTNAISLRGEYKGKKHMANGKTRAEFDLYGSINRFDYGLNWNGLNEAGHVLVGETVELHIQLVLIKNEASLAHFHRGSDGWGRKKLDM